MKASQRLERIEPYPFAQLERRIERKRAEGVDIISLAIGDPDEPTPAALVEAMSSQVHDPSTHRYPSNRGRVAFREAVAAFYERRFGVTLDPETQVLPAIGGKEAIYHLSFAFLDPGDAALVPDPGYPVYTGGPLLAGAEPMLLHLRADEGFAPDLGSIPREALARARLLFLNYPNNPTGAVAPPGLFEQAVELARAHDLLIVHDNAYSEITFDGYVAPSLLATEGAMDVGVEVYSLSMSHNMTGWRCGAVVGNADAVGEYWRLKTNVDSGMFEAIQMTAVKALDRSSDAHVAHACELYRRRRDLVLAALRDVGIEITPPKGTIYIWAPVPEGETSGAFADRVLEETAVVITPGSAYGPGGEGFFRISLTVPDDRLTEALERMRESLTR
jgi:LL-diaminopimelate aminotransferase